jgi:hypothetical protein
MRYRPTDLSLQIKKKAIQSKAQQGKETMDDLMAFLLPLLKARGQGVSERRQPNC